MSDTSWEDSQNRTTRSRFWMWLIIILLGISLAGIIIYNNRDYLSGFPAHAGGKASRELFSTGSGSKGHDADFDKLKTAGETVSVENKVESSTAARDSVALNDIVCRVIDRKDIRIRLAVTLVFSDAGERSEILVRRETMAAVVQKVLSSTVLRDVKIEKLRPVLLTELNAAFEKKVFNDLKIDNIIVEKVNTE